jgi:hypothetical protein
VSGNDRVGRFLLIMAWVIAAPEEAALTIGAVAVGAVVGTAGVALYEGLSQTSATKKAEADRKRLGEAANKEADRKRLEEAANKEAERKRLEEAAKKEAERKRLELEKAKKEEAERQRLELEKAEKEEAERKRLELEKAKKEEAERQRLELEKAEKEEAERQGERYSFDDLVRMIKDEVEEYIDVEEDIWNEVVGNDALAKSLQGMVGANGCLDTDWDAEAKDMFAWALGLYYGEVRNAKSQSSGGGHSGGWARNATRKRALEIVEKAREDKLDKLKQALFEGGLYTIHHKVSQSNLKKLAKRIEADKVHHAQFQYLLGDNVEKGLLNLAANLEVGPVGSKRVGDPGSGFDPNVKDGKMTPRSKMLQDLDRMITRGADLGEAYSLIEEIMGVHGKKYGEKLSEPIVDQWTKQGDKFVRDNK